MDDISWDDLRLVFAIDRAGSLGGGARLLRVDHSTAFRRLNALEARLGVRLFERARTGYSATEAGEAAVAAARRMEEDVAVLGRRIAGADVRPTGTVRLTTTDTLVPAIAPILADFRETYPGIVIELIVSNAFLTLTRRDADVALRPAAMAAEDLVARRIGDVGTAFYAARGRGITVESGPWIAPEDTLSHLASARWIARTVPPDQIAARASTLWGAAEICAAGIGVAPLPCIIGDRDARIARIGDPLPEFSVGLWLMTHPDLRKTGRVRALIDHIAPSLTAMRSEFSGLA